MTAQPFEPDTITGSPTTAPAGRTGRPVRAVPEQQHRHTQGAASAEDDLDLGLNIEAPPTVYTTRRRTPKLKPYIDPPRFELPQRILDAVAHAGNGPSGSERRLTAACRHVLDNICGALTGRTIDAATLNLIHRTTQKHLEANPLGVPAHVVDSDITGAVNVYVRTFLPPAEWRWCRKDLHHELRRSGTLLDPVDQHTNLSRFHPRDRRIGWRSEDGLIVDEIRLGRSIDEPLDEWMLSKIACDLTLGQATAEYLNIPFLGVRVLPLHAPANAQLCRSSNGTIVSRPLRDALPHTMTLPARPARPGRLVSAAARTAAATGNTSTGPDRKAAS